MRVQDTFVAIATGFLAITTLLPLSRSPHWIIRDLDFPRMQLAVGAFLLLLAQTVILDLGAPLAWVLTGITILCLAWQSWWILPYTPLWPVEVKVTRTFDPDRTLSILTANVLTTNRRADALLDLVRRFQPDVLVTLESDRWWQDRLDALQTGMPYTMKCPLDNLYGMHVYSRLPLEEKEIAFLVEEGIPSMHALIRLRTGHRVRAHFLHPTPPRPVGNTDSIQRDAELVMVAKAVGKSSQPVVVAGDLNDVAWSATTRLFRKLSGLLDPRVGRGMFNTFHARYPFLRWPLDHLFHSRHFTLNSIRRLPPIGSDHFPLWAELTFNPERGADQQGLEADQGDESRARDIAAQRGTSEHRVPGPGG